MAGPKPKRWFAEPVLSHERHLASGHTGASSQQLSRGAFARVAPAHTPPRLRASRGGRAAPVRSLTVRASLCPPRRACPAPCPPAQHCARPVLGCRADEPAAAAAAATGGAKNGAALCLLPRRPEADHRGGQEGYPHQCSRRQAVHPTARRGALQPHRGLPLPDEPGRGHDPAGQCKLAPSARRAALSSPSCHLGRAPARARGTHGRAPRGPSRPFAPAC